MLVCGAKRDAWYLGAGLLVSSLLLAGSGAVAGAPLQTPATNTANIQKLKSIRLLLETAKHDYKGHRAKAVHEVTKAIHALEGTPERRHVHHPKKGSLTETQAQSDMQLQAALQQLQALQPLLTSNTAAEAAVGRAIVDITEALKVK